MRISKTCLSAAIPCTLMMLCQIAAAQSPGAQAGAGARPKDYSNSPIVTRMMAFDKKHDGKLTKDEITDERLHSLFDRADTNHDGIVTKGELMALAAKLDAEDQQAGGDSGPGGRGGFGGGFGPGRGPGGPGGRGRGGRGFGGAFGGPPRPGQILPPMLQDTLNLTPEQRSQLADLQKDVDAKLAKILTEVQRRQLNDLRPAGPRGRGGFGGAGAGGPPPPPPPPDREE